MSADLRFRRSQFILVTVQSVTDGIQPRFLTWLSEDGILCSRACRRNFVLILVLNLLQQQILIALLCPLLTLHYSDSSDLLPRMCSYYNEQIASLESHELVREALMIGHTLEELQAGCNIIAPWLMNAFHHHIGTGTCSQLLSLAWKWRSA